MTEVLQPTLTRDGIEIEHLIEQAVDDGPMRCNTGDQGHSDLCEIFVCTDGCRAFAHENTCLYSRYATAPPNRTQNQQIKRTDEHRRRRALLLAQRCRKQQTRFLPITTDGALVDAERLGDLGLAQTAEIPHLHDLGEARIEQRDLELLGYTLTPTIEQRPTGWAATAPEAVDRQAEIEAATARNALILDAVAALAREGRRVLLLADRVAHVEGLANKLVTAGFRAAALTSRSTKRRRAEVLASMGAGGLDVLAATSLADEGLDVASLDAVVLAAPSGNPARVQQRIGRALRPAPGKTARILDFVDGDVWAKAAAKKRRKLYNDLGWSVTHG